MANINSKNSYASPTSELHETPDSDQVPTITQALQRGYNFSIGALISEAWQLIKGIKGIIIGGVLILYVAIFIVSFVIGAVLGNFTAFSENQTLIVIGQIIMAIIPLAVGTPFIAGLSMIAIRRAAGQPYSFSEIFRHFGRIVPMFILAVLLALCINVSMILMLILAGPMALPVHLGIMILLLLPGIYLTVAYTLALPLMVERGLSPWQAMEVSRKAITQHWFKVSCLLLLLGLMFALSTFTLLIGLIWAVPMIFMSLGVLYRTIFGVLPVAR